MVLVGAQVGSLQTWGDFGWMDRRTGVPDLYKVLHPQGSLMYWDQYFKICTAWQEGSWPGRADPTVFHHCGSPCASHHILPRTCHCIPLHSSHHVPLMAPSVVSWLSPCSLPYLLVAFFCFLTCWQHQNPGAV